LSKVAFILNDYQTLVFTKPGKLLTIMVHHYLAGFAPKAIIFPKLGQWIKVDFT
jgi:hypothetical protein